MVLVEIFPLQGHISKVYLHLRNGLKSQNTKYNSYLQLPLSKLPLLLQIFLQPIKPIKLFQYAINNLDRYKKLTLHW